MKIKRFLQGLVLTIGLLLFSSYSFWLNISSAKLTAWLEHQLNLNLSREFHGIVSGAKTEFNGASLSSFTLKSPTEGKLFELTRFKVYVDPIHLLIDQSIDFQFSLYEGAVSGKFKLYPRFSINMQGEEIEINRNTFLRKLGYISSNPTVTFSAESEGSDLASAKSQIKISINSLNLLGNKEIVTLPFEVPEIIQTTMTLDLTKEGDAVSLTAKTQGTASGTAKGQILLTPSRLSSSRINMTLNGTIEPSYENRLGFVQQVLRSFKNSQGSFALKVEGAILYPRVQKLQ